MGVRLGESVGAHEPVVTVVDVSRVRFVGTVPATEGDRLRTGGGVTLALGMEGRTRRNARLVFVSPVADASSGLVEEIAEFDNHDGSIRPGISGRMLY
jgi:multidrug efflux pump subunit AcrA (membrane-fusion protein)